MKTNCGSSPESQTAESSRLENFVRQLSKDEISLLLYLETCLVDQAGRVGMEQMNKDDIEIAKRWNEEGFIKFGRILMTDIYPGSNRTHFVNFSDEAWTLAHLYRKVRGEKNKYIKVA